MPTDRRPSHFRRFGAAAGLTLAVAATFLTTAGTAAAASTQRIADADIAPVCPTASAAKFCTELHGVGTAAVVDDKRANVGRGYLRLSTPGPDDHATVYALALANRKLSEITDLEFETYIEKAGTGNDQIAPSINIPINPMKNGVSFSTLVWEPTYIGPGVVKTGQWQKWSPSTSKGWWATRAEPLTTGQPNKLGFNSYTATFADVKKALPDAVVFGVAANQGSGSTGLIAGVDQLKVNNTTYDFDNPAPSADLGVTLKAPASAARGTTFTATIKVTNAGRVPATTVGTALVLGNGARVVSAPGGFGTGGVAAYTTPTLAAGGSVEFVVTIAVDRTARKPITLLAATHSPLPDANPLNNAVQATVSVS